MFLFGSDSDSQVCVTELHCKGYVVCDKSCETNIIELIKNKYQCVVLSSLRSQSRDRTESPGNVYRGGGVRRSRWGVVGTDHMSVVSVTREGRRSTGVVVKDVRRVDLTTTLG